MYTLDYFSHTLAQATGAAKYDIKTSQHASPEEAYAFIADTVERRNVWDNDGFTQYLKFRITCPDGIVETFKFDFVEHIGFTPVEHIIDGEDVSHELDPTI